VFQYLEQVDPEYARTDGAVLRDGRLDRSHTDAAARLALRPLLAGVAERLVASEKDYVARAGAEAHRWAQQHLRVALKSLECEALGTAFGGACRDRAMAEVATWLLGQEGDAGKLALWGHDGHVARANFAGTMRTMGQELAERLGDGYVAVGFSFDRGGFQAVDMQKADSPGGLREFKVEAAPRESLDGVLARTGLPLAAFDLRKIDGAAGKWLAEATPKREVDAFVRAGGPGFVALPAARAFDLLIFVAETTRARPLPPEKKSK
jgi:erythromycin esterase